MNDVSQPGRPRPFAEFLVALQFLTRLPVPLVRTLDPPPLHQAMGMFPVVGAGIGLAAGAVLVICDGLGLPPYFCAALTLAASALMTGALHEDGLADVADGFGGGKTREQRLEIMQDSRIGAYGTLALCLETLARASLYVALLQLPAWAVITLLASAAAFSRSLMVDFMWATGPARREGLSFTAGRPSRNITLLALGIGGLSSAVAAGLALSAAAGVLALIAAGVTVAAIRALAVRKIGGQTGDVIGCAQILSETAMLAVYAAAFHQVAL